MKPFHSLSSSHWLRRLRQGPGVVQNPRCGSRNTGTDKQCHRGQVIHPACLNFPSGLVVMPPLPTSQSCKPQVTPAIGGCLEQSISRLFLFVSKASLWALSAASFWVSVTIHRRMNHLPRPLSVIHLSPWKSQESTSFSGRSLPSAKNLKSHERGLSQSADRTHITQ